MDQQVKERMVGAAVLVIAAVIFIPMILAGSPQERTAPERSAADARDRAAGVTAAAQESGEGSGFASRIVPLGAPVGTQSTPKGALDTRRERSLDAARKQVSEPLNAQVVAPPGAKPPLTPQVVANQPSSPAPARPAPARAVAKKPAVRKAIKAPEKAPTKAAGGGGWVVQLGSFASSRNAHALRDRLNAKGYKAFARSSGKGADAVTRVYVGPDTSREVAQQRVGRLLDETRLRGIVIRDPN